MRRTALLEHPNNPLAQGYHDTRTILADILACLTQRAVPYALLHHDEREAALNSDIDIGLLEDPTTAVEPILKELEQKGRLTIVQRLHYEIPYGYYYILRMSGNEDRFLHLDCLFDPIGVNRYYLPTPYLLEGKEQHGGHRRITADKEALYLLIKRIVKGEIRLPELESLRVIVSQRSEKLESALLLWFGNEGRRLVHAFLECDQSSRTKESLEELHHLLKRQRRRHHPTRSIRANAYNLRRLTGRLFRPTGYFVVIVGPDGCGKSTVAAALSDQLARAFRKIARFHWRPNVLPKLRTSQHVVDSGSDTIMSPPASSHYRGLTSLVRFLYYWLDFVAGYWLLIYRHKAQTTLVVGERYFPDVIVNPQRYGFSVPQWLLRWTSRLVPKPDLTVLLENDPDVIYARKQELTPPAISDQIRALRNELRFWGQSMIIHSQADAPTIAREISNVILRDCRSRIKSR